MDNLPSSGNNSFEPPQPPQPPPLNPNPSNPLPPPNPSYTPYPPSPSPLSSEASAKEDDPVVLTHQEVAQHEPRDSHGRFTKDSTPEPPQNPQTAPIQPEQPRVIPPIIEVNQNTEPSEKSDPPLFGFFLTNPVTYLKLFLKRLLKRQAITLKIPVLAIIVIMVGIGGFGLGFQSGTNWALARLFPNYSPILHRSITEQGVIQKSSRGYFLKSDDKEGTLWTLKSISANVKIEDYKDQRVQIKGNLTPTPNLIEVSEIISFESEPSPITQTTLTTPNSPNTLTLPDIPSQDSLPKLYPGLQWDLTQRKTLIFTSGKRKIEQEGVYLESALTPDFPQAFIDYYTGELANSGFKQTFNSRDPDNTTITFAKNELFLTFGTKSIYSGSGENRKISGYKAFIEHN